VQTKNLALGGISSAFVIILLYLASVMPTSRLFMLCLCSFLVAILVIETGFKKGIIFYLATSVLSFLIIPSKAIVLLYIAFFGIYSLIKAQVEILQNKVLQILLKLFTFNLLLAFITYLAKIVTGIESFAIHPTLPTGALWLGLQLAFLFYDYTFTAVISYYSRHFHGKP